MSKIELTPEEHKAFVDAKAELDALKAKPAPKPEGDPKPKPPEPEGGIRDKAIEGKRTEDERKAESEALEAAVTFNMGRKAFLEENAEYLPEEVTNIFKVAESETYDSNVTKANRLKAALVESFFAIEGNVELLVPAQKSALDSYQKLTKEAKEKKASAVYENIFEPALEMTKRVRKAEELGKARNGIYTPGTVEANYKKRLVDQARKHHLGK